MFSPEVPLYEVQSWSSFGSQMLAVKHTRTACCGVLVAFHCNSIAMMVSPDGINWVVQAHADSLKHSRQQALGSLQTALACSGNAHCQRTRHVSLLLDWHFGAHVPL